MLIHHSRGLLGSELRSPLKEREGYGVPLKWLLQGGIDTGAVYCTALVLEEPNFRTALDMFLKTPKTPCLPPNGVVPCPSFMAV